MKPILYCSQNVVCCLFVCFCKIFGEFVQYGTIVLKVLSVIRSVNRWILV